MLPQMPRKINVQDKLSRATAVHAAKYDYTRVAYVSAKAPVTIVCPIHGDFLQRLDHHLAGSGCRACAAADMSVKMVAPFSRFLLAAEAAHPGKYQYPAQDYRGAGKLVRVICPRHGEFSQRATHHTAGHGCPDCGHEVRASAKRLDLETFIARSRAVHGGKYGYDRSVYTVAHTPTRISCPIHGAFMQRPSAHMLGKGCPACSKYGFQRHREAALYFLRADGGAAVKIGITNALGQRLPQLRRATPFEFSILAVAFGPGEKAAVRERELLAVAESCGYSDFDGASEWVRPCERVRAAAELYAAKGRI